MCVSLRSRHFNISQEPLYTDIYRKSPELRRALCASLHNRNARQHVIRPTLYRNFQEKCRAQNLWPHFVRACAVEMHFNISREPLYTEICRKNAAPQSEHPDQALAFTPTVRTTQFGHAVGEKHENERPAPLSRRSYPSSPTAASLHKKNIMFRAPASSPTQVPCNTLAAITM